MSFLRSRAGVLRSPVPCWTRWALWGRSGGAPEASRGCSGGPRGGLGDLSGASGDGPGTPESDLFECRSDFGGALGGDGQNKYFLGGFGVFFLRRFWMLYCLRLSLFRSRSRARGEKATPSNLTTLTRDLRLFFLCRKMKQRSKLVGKPTNLDSDRGLQGDSNSTTILSPFGDHFGSKMARKSSRRASK